MTRLFIILFLASQVHAGPLSVLERFVLSPAKGYTFENRPQERTQPVIMGNFLYTANLNGEVQAVHRKQAYSFWKKKLDAGVDGALSFGRAKVFVGDIRGNLYALRSRDGSQAWKYKIRAEWLAPPLLFRDKVYAASSDGGLYAINEADGTEAWTYFRRGVEKMTIRGRGKPAIFGGELYAGFADGTFVALSAETGKELWTRKLSSRDRFYDVDSPPKVIGNSILVASYDGTLFKLNRQTGKNEWAFRVGSYGGFAVRDGKIYFSGLDGYFYALDFESGHTVWRTKYKSGIGLTPVVVGDAVVVSTSDDPVYLLNAKDGKILWQGRLGAGTLASATADPDGWFYVQSNYGNLYSYEIRQQRGPNSMSQTLALPSAINSVSDDHTSP